MIANIFTFDSSGVVDHCEKIDTPRIDSICKAGGSIVILSQYVSLDSLLTMREIIEGELVCRSQSQLENAH